MSYYGLPSLVWALIVIVIFVIIVVVLLRLVFAVIAIGPSALGSGDMEISLLNSIRPM